MTHRSFRWLWARRRRSKVDAAYARAYTEQPIDTPDDWGDLASFRESVPR